MRAGDTSKEGKKLLTPPPVPVLRSVVAMDSAISSASSVADVHPRPRRRSKPATPYLTPVATAAIEQGKTLYNVQCTA